MREFLPVGDGLNEFSEDFGDMVGKPGTEVPTEPLNVSIPTEYADFVPPQYIDFLDEKCPADEDEDYQRKLEL